MYRYYAANNWAKLWQGKPIQAAIEATVFWRLKANIPAIAPMRFVTLSIFDLI